jgi:serine/threonine-protein kinase
LYRRTQSKSGLWAVPFAPERSALAGEPFLISPDGSSPSVANDGTLLYVSGGSDELRQLVWVDRDGSIDEKPVGAPMLGIGKPALSPDGRRVAVMGREDEKGNIWVYDLERNTRSRLTFGSQMDWDPTWSADGRQVVFWHGETRTISKKSADGTGEIERIVTQEFRDSGVPSISADGKWMAFWILPTGELGIGDLWYQKLEQGAEALPIVETPFDEDYAMISPRGDLLVYESDESGRPEVYLTQFPGGDGRWQVSVDGGTLPRWSRAGDEIYYVEGTVMKAVGVATEPSVRLGAPQTLFDFAGTGIDVAQPRIYDVAADGRFLMVQDVRDEQGGPTLVLSYDWIERR